MRILVTGAHGQLGRRVIARATALGHELVMSKIDICKSITLPPCDLVINAAAYTAVDKAELESERAFAVNRDGAANLARVCRDHGVTLIHVSTDYVFDGTASSPYREDDSVTPLSVYGASKAEGERAVLDLGGTVVRTSWLFGEGGPSFVHSILRLARERLVLRVVADQHGCPTYAGDLAEALLALAPAPHGIYHYCGDEVATWHAVAVAVIKAAHLSVVIEPISTADYPTAARRPLYSVLDTLRVRTLGIAPSAWRSRIIQVVTHELRER